MESDCSVMVTEMLLLTVNMTMMFLVILNIIMVVFLETVNNITRGRLLVKMNVITIVIFLMTA